MFLDYTCDGLSLARCERTNLLQTPSFHRLDPRLSTVALQGFSGHPFPSHLGAYTGRPRTVVAGGRQEEDPRMLGALDGHAESR